MYRFCLQRSECFPPHTVDGNTTKLTTMRFPGIKDWILEATVESSFRLLTSLCTPTRVTSQAIGHRSQVTVTANETSRGEGVKGLLVLTCLVSRLSSLVSLVRRLGPIGRGRWVSSRTEPE